jgi:hypothetical protein
LRYTDGCGASDSLTRPETPGGVLAREAPASSSIPAISSWQLPQSVPAPHASPTASTEAAPARIAARIVEHRTPRQMQTIIGASHPVPDENGTGTLQQ